MSKFPDGGGGGEREKVTRMHSAKLTTGPMPINASRFYAGPVVLS